MCRHDQRARDIFCAALEFETQEERLDYVASQCDDDLSLKERVEKLLLAFDQAGRFLVDSAVTQDRVEPGSTDPALGSQIGPYKLLQQIGHGGMGIVYMAEQTEPVKRRVALKVIKWGMDTHQVIARFEAERQALAMMDHPNIAKVLDAGATDNGRPYFVMELVRGIPLTEYCDQENLSPRQRLELFIPLCHAVQHAHQKGIIHRDLKPTNVLVALYDGQPVPKVIDFGIAKAMHHELTERTMFTLHGQVVGTLEYMSPEQAQLNEIDVDTRSDIYSLGVLLYELLTGTTPIGKETLRRAGFAEMLQVVRDVDPVKPSERLSQSGDALPSISALRGIEPKRLSIIIKGELDWIVMKALDKDRTRRYETATSFSEDLERYLRDEPVRAGPPTTAYRIRKFAARNRVALVTFSLFIASLLTIAVWNYSLALRAMRAEELAREHTAQARSAAIELQRANAAESAQRERAERHAADAQRRAEEARYQAYVADMQLAASAGVDAAPQRLATQLKRHIPRAGERDLRGWEWHYLNALQNRGQVIDRIDSTTKCRMSWSPTQNTLAMISPSGNLRFWNPGDVPTQAAARLDKPTAVAWHDEKATLLVGNAKGQLLAVDPHLGDPQVIVNIGRPITQILPNPKQQTVILLADADGFFVNLRDERAFAQPLGVVWAAAWSPNGQWLAMGNGADRQAGLVLKNFSNEEQIEAYRPQKLNESIELSAIAWHPTQAGTVAFCPWQSSNGASVYFAHVDFAQSTSNEATSSVAHRSGPYGFRISACAWSPDGDRLALGSNTGVVQLLDTHHQQGSSFPAHTDWVRAVEWDGDTLMTCGDDGTYKRWDLSRDTQPYQTLEGVGRLAWHPNPETRLLAMPGNETIRTERTVRVVDYSTGETIRLLEAGRSGWLSALAWNPRNPSQLAATLAWPSQHLAVWDLRNADGQATLMDTAEARTLDWHPSRDQIALGRLDGKVEIRSLGGDSVVTLPGATRRVVSVRFNHDGSLLACANEVNELRIWCTEDWGLRYMQEFGASVPGDGQYMLAWSPNDVELAVINGSGVVNIFNVQRGQLERAFNAHAAMGISLDWHPDGNRLATGGSDGSVRIWDALTGTELMVLKTPSPVVGSLRWGQRGQCLAAAAGPKAKIIVWDAPRSESPEQSHGRRVR